MSSYLSRLVDRTLGRAPVVQPILAPRFGRGPDLPAEGWAAEAVREAPTTRDGDPTSRAPAPVRAFAERTSESGRESHLRKPCPASCPREPRSIRQGCPPNRCPWLRPPSGAESRRRWRSTRASPWVEPGERPVPPAAPVPGESTPQEEVETRPLDVTALAPSARQARAEQTFAASVSGDARPEESQRAERRIAPSPIGTLDEGAPAPVRSPSAGEPRAPRVDPLDTRGVPVSRATSAAPRSPGTFPPRLCARSQKLSLPSFRGARRALRRRATMGETPKPPLPRARSRLRPSPTRPPNPRPRPVLTGETPKPPAQVCL